MGLQAAAQDLPLFTQKLTNTFLYNPSVAGNDFGSITFSHRQFWSGVDDSPRSNFISAHTPFGYHKFGVGVNLLSERIGVYDNIYGNAAFAYHIKITDESTFSMGVSAEYSNLRIDPSRVDVLDGLNSDQPDPLIFGNADARNNLDFSFGLSYSSKYFDIGGAANRLRTFAGLSNDGDQISEFYSGFLNVKLPIAGGRDLLEPTVTFRQLSPESNQIDVGLFYIFQDAIIVGGSYRTGSLINLTAALRFQKRFLVGYSYEMFGGDIATNVGNSSEITLRYDFRDAAQHKSYRNSRKIMSQSLSFRRKTLTRANSKAKNINNSALKKRLKRNYLKSPNYRINSSKKLQTQKRRKGSFNVKKRQRQNFKKYSRRRRR